MPRWIINPSQQHCFPYKNPKPVPRQHNQKPENTFKPPAPQKEQRKVFYFPLKTIAGDEDRPSPEKWIFRPTYYSLLYLHAMSLSPIIAATYSMNSHKQKRSLSSWQSCICSFLFHFSFFFPLWLPQKSISFRAISVLGSFGIFSFVA